MVKKEGRSVAGPGSSSTGDLRLTVESPESPELAWKARSSLGKISVLSMVKKKPRHESET
jgi:hypothetical protein